VVFLLWYCGVPAVAHPTPHFPAHLTPASDLPLHDSTGMQKCLACKAGTYPDNSGGKDGPDMCTTCEAGKFRAAFTASATCAACVAGSEVGSSNHAACVQW